MARCIAEYIPARGINNPIRSHDALMRQLERIKKDHEELEKFVNEYRKNVEEAE